MDIPAQVYSDLGLKKNPVPKRSAPGQGQPRGGNGFGGGGNGSGRNHFAGNGSGAAGTTDNEGKGVHVSKMQFIKDLREGESIHEIYLCKKKQELKTKAGKAYDSLTLQDKTGTLDAKIWEPGSMGIGDFDNLDYVDVFGDITSFQGNLQLNVRRIRRCNEGEYDPADYLPVSEKSVDQMYKELLAYITRVEEPHFNALLKAFFVEDEDFIKAFRGSSAAKTMHHGFVGGLLEHTLSVTNLCYCYCKLYPMLQKDLLLTAAMLHDVGKTRELSAFPRNDYTDEGQLIGHIVIGVEMIDEKLKDIPDFPELPAMELRHCILAHHGKLEFGSPKVPALMEAAALNFADNTDAHLEMFKEVLLGSNTPDWAGFQAKLESNVRHTEI